MGGKVHKVIFKMNYLSKQLKRSVCYFAIQKPVKLHGNHRWKARVQDKHSVHGKMHALAHFPAVALKHLGIPLLD